jgi:hypothetical protein
MFTFCEIIKLGPGIELAGLSLFLKPTISGISGTSQ